MSKPIFINIPALRAGVANAVAAGSDVVALTTNEALELIQGIEKLVKSDQTNRDILFAQMLKDRCGSH